MNPNLNRLSVVATEDDSIDKTFRAMAVLSREVACPGLAIIINNNGRLLGVVTDGDLRRAYERNVPFDARVAEIMVTNPITIDQSTPREKMIPEIHRRIHDLGRHQSQYVRYVPVLDESENVVDIIDVIDLLQNQGMRHQTVAIFGMGYVGLTLAVSLANRGHQVTGIDINNKIINDLNASEPHVYEPGLREMLNLNILRGKLKFSSSLDTSRRCVFIIAVGTPLRYEQEPDVDALLNVVEVIGRALRRGDQVMLRSTVPMGTTTNIVIPRLEELSELVAGTDFHITFCPERTIEGKALHELRELPQIIGGRTQACVRKASEFWSTLTQSVIKVQSIEAAELVKLANNTFRDLSFAFANELALLADEVNVDAFNLIRAANDGYPRNPISYPSPGVGGYCLTKDPILYGSSVFGIRENVTLGRASRAINQRAGGYVIEVVERFSQRVKKPLEEMKVVILGIAFKGVPETNDIRGSVALEIAAKLKNRVEKLTLCDFEISAKTLSDLDFNSSDNVNKVVEEADAILILNNHRRNVEVETLLHQSESRLIFDGWHQLDAAEIESAPGLIYSTMGYMTPQ
jgi:UDP-N-acetyl-D-mannosaminuronic acid dehydrogenase